MWVGKTPGKLASITAMAFAPDGRTLYTGDSKGWILAWDTATHESKTLRRPQKGDGGVYTLWPTPDDARRLLYLDRQAVWDALSPDLPMLKRAEGNTGDWRYLLPDGKRVMSCEQNYRIGLWNLETGKRLKVPGELGAATHITHHQLLPDGVTLLTYTTADHTLPLWNLKTGKRLGELSPGGHGINPCTLSKDGGAFAVGRNKKLWVYDVPSRSLRHQLKFEKDFRELAFHPNGRLVASASTNSVVTLWDVEAGERAKQLDWNAGKVESVAFAPDGLTCAAGGFEKFVVFDIDL
jgi:WD40 repeat protein